MTFAYKFLGESLTSDGGGEHEWEIGKWYKLPVGYPCHEIKCCQYGFHASRKILDVLDYCYGPRLFLVEYRGVVDKNDDKIASSEMKLFHEIFNVKLIITRFARDCARRAAQYAPRYAWAVARYARDAARYTRAARSTSLERHHQESKLVELVWKLGREEKRDTPCDHPFDPNCHWCVEYGKEEVVKNG